MWDAWSDCGDRLDCAGSAQAVALARSQHKAKADCAVMNQVWATDFVHDTCANGQKLKFLAVAE